MEAFDEHPLLRSGEEPPGRFEPSGPGGLSVWRGQTTWRTTHGKAHVLHRLGRPVSITGAVDLDFGPGPLPTLTTFSPTRPDRWRYASANGTFVHGTVMIDRDMVRFTRCPLPPRVDRYADEGRRDLRDDLAASPAFLVRLRDRDFAVAAYLAFTNQAYASGDERCSVSLRAAGAFVAEQRDVGESYIDFFLSGPGDLADPESLDREVLEVFAGLGWRRLDADDRADDHAAAGALMAGFLLRAPDTHPTEWFGEGRRARTSNIDEAYLQTTKASLSDAAFFAAGTGRLSEADWDRFWDLYDFEADLPARAKAMEAVARALRPMPASPH